MRVQSIDIVRGLVMVLMAIDHVRVYAGVPAGGTDPAIFFTRWVTHFCAPVFAFLAGTSAYLSSRKSGDTGKLAKFLVSRGLLLVVLELTLIKFFWTFRLDYSFTLAGVIWMLGWCMVLLAPMVRWLPVQAVGWIGVAIMLFQQVFGLVPKLGWLWEFVYPAGNKGLPDGIAILYVLVPWIGVMAAGYGFGSIMTMDPARRRSLCLKIGLGATAVFLIIGCVKVVMQPQEAPFVLQVLNQQKYPASQLFLLMTLGPAIALMGLLENGRQAPGRISGIFETFGRVPMFYYLMHIPLIHIAALVVNLLLFGAMHDEMYANAPFARVPGAFRWSLPMLYFVFAVVVTILYFPSRWMAGWKARNHGRAIGYFLTVPFCLAIASAVG